MNKPSSPVPAVHAQPVATAADSRPERRRRMSAAGVAGLAIIALWMAAAVFGPWMLAKDSGDMGDAAVFAPMGGAHWLGTDYLGRDMFSRIVEGTRYTVGVALVATLCASFAGITLALLAAVRGGMIDALMSRSLDTLVSIPSKMFALLMVAAFGPSVPMLVLIAAIVYAPGAYRIARALAVNIGAMDYVTVARTRGEGTWYVMRREILPNIAGPMLSDLGLRFVYVVLLLAGMSFLGVGIQPPDADWGSLVRENIGGLSEAAPAIIAPALAIASLTIAVNLAIDALGGSHRRSE